MPPREEWRPVASYEGRYDVSRLGRIRSLPRTCRCAWGKDRSVASRFLRPYRHPVRAFLTVTLRKDGAGGPVYVHKLVADAFLKRPSWGKKLRFKDGDKNNCRASNLEWVRNNNGYKGNKSDT